LRCGIRCAGARVVIGCATPSTSIAGQVVAATIARARACPSGPTTTYA
jgi:hypothetical protein